MEALEIEDKIMLKNVYEQKHASNNSRLRIMINELTYNSIKV